MFNVQGSRFRIAVLRTNFLTSREGNKQPFQYINPMDIYGVWKGEYIVQHHRIETGKEIPVPFIMKIKSPGEDTRIPIGKGLFEGICQDDPVISKVAFHATITGSF